MPVETLRRAPIVKSTDASISMPRWPRSAHRRSAVAVGVVEDVARHDRPDVHPHLALARPMRTAACTTRQSAVGAWGSPPV